MTIAQPRYYLLSNNGLAPCTVDSERYAGSLVRHCRECRELVALEEPIRLPLLDVAMGRVPLNMVHGFSRIGLIRVDLLGVLPPEAVRQCLVLGPAEDGNGTEMRNWRSFFSPHEVVVRGTSHVAFRRCPECGWPFYFALGRRYLCPEPLPGVSLAHAGYGQLVVSGDLFRGLGGVLAKRVSALPLEVSDEPRDGLERILRGRAMR